MNNKQIIVAENKEHLIKIIKEEIAKNGYKCNLNHIDTSLITDMSKLFHTYHFNGHISKWNVSNVTNMSSMFSNCNFCNDISNWNVSNVKDMTAMFSYCPFNKDISKWDVTNLKYARYIFFESKFKKDISAWNVKNMQSINDIFEMSKAPIPYWAKIHNTEERNNTIEAYHCKTYLDKTINKNKINNEVFKV